MSSDTDIPFRFHLISVATICVLGIVIYANATRGPFVFDDIRNIQMNRSVHLTQLGVRELTAAAFEGHSRRRPVANISFGLNYFFAGNTVTGYHVFNIVVHLINGLIVYCLGLSTLRQLHETAHTDATRRDWRSIALIALCAALFFVAHPIQTQAVTYTVQRMTSMASLFYLLALLLYIYGRRAITPGSRWALWICGLISWMLALGSKEIAVTLPLIVLVYEWYFFRNLSREWLVRRCRYGILVTGLLALMAFLYLNEQIIDFSIRDFTMGQRVLTQFRVVVFYLSLILFPHPARLNLLHHVATSPSLAAHLPTGLSLAAILGLLVVAVAMAKAHRMISFGIIWFLIHLVIESSFLRLELIYEHRVYLPSFGIALLLSVVLRHLLSRRPVQVVIVTVLITLLLAASSHSRNSIWQDGVGLWRDVAAKSPKSHRAYANLGTIYDTLGVFDVAVGYHRRAIELNPRYVTAHYNLGKTLHARGALDEAAKCFLRAIELESCFALAHHDYAEILVVRGRIDEGIERYRQALKCDPDSAISHNNLALALRSKGLVSQTLRHLRRAIELSPDYAKAHYNLGATLSVDGTLEDAIYHYHRALDIDPGLTDARRALADALRRRRAGTHEGQSKRAGEQESRK